MFRWIHLIFPRISFPVFIVLLFPAGFLHSQSVTFSVKLQWTPVENIKISDDNSFGIVSFSGSSDMSGEYGTLPVFSKRFPLPQYIKDADLKLVNV
jgi:hypothetical protein